MHKVPADDDSEEEDGDEDYVPDTTQDGNMARRRRRVRAAAAEQVPQKKQKIEKTVVGVTFKRCLFEFDAADGTKVKRDFAFDWKVLSPHAVSVLASSRGWHAAHAETAILLPSDLRAALEEDLGIDDPPPDPPGQGQRDDRPRGTACSSGTLRTGQAGLTFSPARPPHRSADGYLTRDEAVPWERMKELKRTLEGELRKAKEENSPLEKDWRETLKRGLECVYRFLHDVKDLPQDEDGVRWKPTSYARKMSLGRLVAVAGKKHCSMQPMPNIFRKWLYRGILHDLDFENCHPTIILGLVKLCRPDTWQLLVPALAEYVEDRTGFLDDIVAWYGLANREFAKTAILVACNGGELRYWRARR